MTGLIYVAIIAVWAVVLVPAWLRRHDHLDPERSVDRFARSMQTLGSRPSVLGIPMPSHEDQDEPDATAATEVVRRRHGLRRGGKLAPGSPARGTQAGAQTGAQSGAQTGPQGISGSSSGGAAPRRLTAAARRRVVLSILLTALLVVAALVVPGIFSPVALAVPAGLIVGFLALARRQVRVARRARSRAPRQSTARTADPAPSHSAPATTADGVGSTWEARATPLPTYVTAPPAAGYPRAIDQTPGAWTAAAMLERAQKQKDRAERMAAAKAEAIARARAEQEAAQVTSRDDEFLSAQAITAARHDTVPLRRFRAVNE